MRISDSLTQNKINLRKGTKELSHEYIQSLGPGSLCFPLEIVCLTVISWLFLKQELLFKLILCTKGEQFEIGGT